MPTRFRLTTRNLATCLVLCAAFGLGGPAGAQSYPAKPVKIVVPFGPGGPTDVTARIVAQHLTVRLGQQFIVENAGGAGGNTGAGQVARAAPDGYTLMITSTGFMVNPSLYAKVPYDAKKDFAPLSLLAASPNVLTVHPSVPAKTVMELVAAIKAKPAEFSFAQPATGSTPHLSGELFKLQFGLKDYTMVPFSSAAQAISSTLAGHTPTAFTALPPAIAAVKAGHLRALAVTSAKRIAALPDVPTMTESGIAGQEAETLTGMFVPAGTPRPIIDRLAQEVAAIVKLPEVAEKLTGLGFVPVGDTPEQWGKRVDEEIAKWAKVIKEANIPKIQ